MTTQSISWFIRDKYRDVVTLVSISKNKDKDVHSFSSQCSNSNCTFEPTPIHNLYLCTGCRYIGITMYRRHFLLCSVCNNINISNSFTTRGATIIWSLWRLKRWLYSCSPAPILLWCDKVPKKQINIYRRVSLGNAWSLVRLRS